MAADKKPDPLDYAALVPELHARIQETTRTLIWLQAFVLTLVAYQRERPDYDDARFKALYAEQKARLQIPEPTTGTADLDRALQALLTAFEGPPQ